MSSHARRIRSQAIAQARVGGAMLEAKKILVPVNGNATDVRTVSLACQMARRSKGHVYAIYVIDNNNAVAIPLGGSGNESDPLLRFIHQ